MKFTYNADGKIATRTATYYAKQNQVTDIESTAIYNPSSGYGIPGWLYNEAQTLSATQIFDKLFPNDDIYDQIGGSHEFANHEYEAGDRKELFIEKMVGNTYGGHGSYGATPSTRCSTTEAPPTTTSSFRSHERNRRPVTAS